ncbi:MAG: hypothetical protein IVW54_11675 [Candidatus Binataceae bacterium]|nr:hypothetical protein [Candidatus Binataceae bacterium]
MICGKKVTATIFAVMALALVSSGRPAMAQAVGPSPIPGQTLFLFSFIGSGPSTFSCNEGGNCTSSFEGIANGVATGRNAQVSSNFSWNFYNLIIAGNQICFPVDGTGTVTTKHKGQLDFFQVGLLCGPAGDGFSPAPAAFNGSFLITGGTGRFAESVGGGSATASSNPNGFVQLFVEGSVTWKGKAPRAG